MEHAQAERKVTIHEGTRTGKGTKRALEILGGRTEEAGGLAQGKG